MANEVAGTEPLINVKEENGLQTVSMRELYEKLGITERFSSWFERVCAYGFREPDDFTSVKSFTLVNNGAKKPIDDYKITIEMAKQICMLQRSEKGRMYREYFLTLEKAWNSPEAVMARALQVANRTLSDILNYDDNIERIFYILYEQKIFSDKNGLSRFYQKVKENGMTKVLKELNCYRTTGRGENKQSVCNPYIWILVAMELNPQIYAKVVIWLTDKLILNRIEAGNFYKSLAAALYKISNPDYKAVAVALNTAVFGKHETGIRNKGSEKELGVLYRLEDNIAFAINRGFVKTMPEILSLIKESADQENSIAAA